jgi:hypothetical protein
MMETIFLEWNIGDVKFLRPDLSKEECAEVPRAVYATHDPNIGVNWVTLVLWAEKIYPLTESDRARVEKFKADDWNSGLEFEQMNDILKKAGLKVRGAPMQPRSGVAGGKE